LRLPSCCSPIPRRRSNDVGSTLSTGSSWANTSGQGSARSFPTSSAVHSPQHRRDNLCCLFRGSSSRS
jgi:hypothetical protein